MVFETTLTPEFEYDFSGQIQVAIENAPLTELTGSGLQEKVTIENIRNGDWSTNPSLADVATKDSHAYPILVRQAFEMISPDPDPSLVDLATRHVVTHEMEHAAVAQMLGYIPEYGVKFVKTIKPQGLWVGILPFIRFSGSDLRREDYALVVSASSWQSESDLERLKALGYSSPSEVFEKHSFFQDLSD